jgi:hypothetical protein
MENGILRIGAPAGASSPGAMYALSGRRVGEAVAIRAGEWRVPIKGIQPGRYIFVAGKAGSQRAVPIAIPVTAK